MEDGVVAVVPLADEALAVLHAQQAVAGAVVPAPRALEEVAAEGGHVADLRRADLEGRLPERRVRPAMLVVLEDLGQAGAGADRQAAGRCGSPEMPARALMSLR